MVYFHKSSICCWWQWFLVWDWIKWFFKVVLLKNVDLTSLELKYSLSLTCPIIIQSNVHLTYSDIGNIPPPFLQWCACAFWFLSCVFILWELSASWFFLFPQAISGKSMLEKILRSIQNSLPHGVLGFARSYL